MWESCSFIYRFFLCVNLFVKKLFMIAMIISAAMLKAIKIIA